MIPVLQMRTQRHKELSLLQQESWNAVPSSLAPEAALLVTRSCDIPGPQYITSLPQEVIASAVPGPVTEYTGIFSLRDQRGEAKSTPSTPCKITHHRAFKQKPAGPSLDPSTAAGRSTAQRKPAYPR